MGFFDKIKRAFTGETPEEIYTQIYKAIVSYINHKTGAKRVEYSTNEIMDLLKSQSQRAIYRTIEQILTRGEAVRFAPVSSEDAKADLLEFRRLLEEADRGWT